MALDILALLTLDGNRAQTGHMFTGKTGDMVAVVDMLNTAHCENHRLHVTPALASRFHNGATYPTPYAWLAKTECHVLIDAITDFGQSTPKATKACKLADLLASSVCIY